MTSSIARPSFIRPNALTVTANPNSPVNVPNAITSVRFLLAIAVMVLIPWGYNGAALVVFSIAAATDWMDGYWARKYGQVTKLGRIFDPFVDKIIICGSFIALIALPDSPVAPWMATIVVARELLVTSLRAMIEGAGGDFSANQLGKWKMVLQCAAVIAILAFRWFPQTNWIGPVSIVLLWLSLVLTIYSGYVYVQAAIIVMSQPANETSVSDSTKQTS
jgi:CDP-diacylglycerol---glycerol-3-phosphate 3-phosphatidyltransferase